MGAMKDSGVEWIGEIPAEWKTTPFKFLLLNNDGGVWGDEPKDDGKDCVVLRSTEQTVDGNWRISNPAMRSMAGVAQSENYILEAGDLLITKSSGSLEHIGKTTLFEKETYNRPCRYSNFMQRLRLIRKCIPRYYWYLLNCDVSRAQFVYLQNSTIGLGNISASAIGQVLFPFPPKHEQNEIAAFLDKSCAAIDATVETLETQLSTLERYRSSVIHEAVTRGLDPTAPTKPSGIDWIGDFPQGWETMPFKYVASVVANLVEPSKYPQLIEIDPENIESGTGRLVNVRTVEEVGAISAKQLFAKGQIIYSKIRPVLNKVVIAPEDGLCSADMYPIATRHNARWLLYLMRSDVFVGQTELISNRVAMPKINVDQLGALKIPVPPVEQQAAIANFLDARTAAIDAVIETKRRQLDVLKRRRQSLIYEYVTGKRRVCEEG